MAATIPVYVGYTHAAIVIPPDHPKGHYIGDLVRRSLTEHTWDPRRRRIFEVRKFCYYDYETSSLRIPIGFLNIFSERLHELGIDTEQRKLPDYPIRSINLKMNPKFTDRPHQVDAIRYLSDPSTPRRGLSLQPGAGKTYSATKAIANLKHAAIIVVAGLVEQWVKSIREQTNAEDEVYVLKEHRSLEMLMGSDWKPSVFVASLATMRLFMGAKGNYAELPMDFKEFFKHYGIGTKVYDEVHRDFHATTMMDLYTNVPNNIYLTATFTQSGAECRRIFDIIYPTSMRFGEDRYKQYVTVFMYGYHGEVLERKVVTNRGYMHARYEAQLMKTERKFQRYVEMVIKPRIDSHYINVRKKNQKLLIFVSTIQMLQKLKQELEKYYPSLVIKEYVGGSPESNLADGVDIIITVPQKGGTGLDIKNLKTAYNTISTKAPTQIEQWLGRLRELNPGESLIYVDQYDLNLESHQRHVYERREILKRKARDYHEHVINYI